MSGISFGLELIQRKVCPKQRPEEFYQFNGETSGLLHDQGTADTIGSNLDQVIFHIFTMKEYDYTAMVTSTYGVNEKDDRHHRHKEPIRILVRFF